MSSSMSLSFMNFLFLVCQSCSRRPQFYFLLSSLPSFLPTFVLCVSPLCITHCNERVGCTGWVGGVEWGGGGGGGQCRSMSLQRSAAIVFLLPHQRAHVFVCGVPVKINAGPKAMISEGAKEEKKDLRVLKPNQNEHCAISQERLKLAFLQSASSLFESFFF